MTHFVLAVFNKRKWEESKRRGNTVAPGRAPGFCFPGCEEVLGRKQGLEWGRGWRWEGTWISWGMDLRPLPKEGGSFGEGWGWLGGWKERRRWLEPCYPEIRLLTSHVLRTSLLFHPQHPSDPSQDCFPAVDGPKVPFLSLTVSALDFAAAVKFYFAAERRRTK